MSIQETTLNNLKGNIKSYTTEIIDNIKVHPDLAIHSSRKILEAISKYVYMKEKKLSDKQISNEVKRYNEQLETLTKKKKEEKKRKDLNEILNFFDKEKKIPVTVRISMRSMQAHGNFSSHDQDEKVRVNSEQLQEVIPLNVEFIDTCMKALHNVLNWFLVDYLNDEKFHDILINDIKEEIKKKKNLATIKKQKNIIDSFTSDELRLLTKKIKADFEDLEFFKGKFTLFSIQKTLPTPKHIGIYDFEGEELKEFVRQTKQFEIDNKAHKELTNEPHAIMNFDTKLKMDIKKDIEYMPYYSTNYIGIRTLRKLGYKPQIISAGAITISPIERKLFFQQRGNKVATYKHSFHIMGGNYIGKITEGLEVSTDKEDIDLSRTIFREILEESSVNTNEYDCKTGLYSIGIEDDTGFIQVEAHAVCLLNEQDINHDKEHTDITANWEGGIYSINFDSVEDFLKYTYDRWVPSGFAHVMIWLALGAPYAPELDGKRVYESVLKHIKGNKDC